MTLTDTIKNVEFNALGEIISMTGSGKVQDFQHIGDKEFSRSHREDVDLLADIRSCAEKKEWENILTDFDIDYVEA